MKYKKICLILLVISLIMLLLAIFTIDKLNFIFIGLPIILMSISALIFLNNNL